MGVGDAREGETKRKEDQGRALSTADLF